MKLKRATVQRFLEELEPVTEPGSRGRDETNYGPYL